MVGNLSWQWLKFTNWIVLGGDLSSVGWLSLGAPSTRKMSRISLAMHEVRVHEQSSSHPGMITSHGLEFWLLALIIV